MVFAREIIKLKTINKNILVERSKLLERIDFLNEEIEKRIDYIVDKFCEVLGKKYYSWVFCNECNHFYDNAIQIVVYMKDKRDLYLERILLKDGYYSVDEIPIRWLFKDFEKELIKGRKKYLIELKKLKKNGK
jgi:hypothetical protein